MKYLILTIFLFIGSLVYSQTGYISGNVEDGEFNSSLIGATVTLVDDPTKGVVTDIDGNYKLELKEGTYNIKVSFISYESQIFENIKVVSNQTSTLDVVMKTASQQLKIVEIEAEVRKNTEVAMLIQMKKATNVTDGLSVQTFRKIGDSNLNNAIKRVTGVSVQNNKYVYVRGLGDRYVKTTLNGMNLPGLDPDVNSFQIDLFPTTVLENVNVYKNFSPNLYGDFTGGLVNIETKKFPSQKLNRVSFSTSYIPGSHFNNRFVSQKRYSLDLLGYGNIPRKIPIDPFGDFPNVVLDDPKLTEITKSFNSDLAVRYRTMLPNMSFSYNKGNTIEKNGYKIGYNLVLNYSRSSVLYEDFENNTYLKAIDDKNYNLEKFIQVKGDVGRENTLWSGLLTYSLKKDNHKLNISLLNIQNGEANSSFRTNKDFEQTNATLVENILTYTSRLLSNVMVDGSHTFDKFKFNWKNSSSYSTVSDPDFRETKISITDGDTTLNTGDGAGIDRYWRYLTEIGNSTRGDITFNIKNTKVNTGIYTEFRRRRFDLYNYKHRYNGGNIDIDPDWFLEDDNIWVPETDTGTFTLDGNVRQNSFRARRTNFSTYLMGETEFSFIKAIYGVRAEKNDMFYTGRNNSNTIVYSNEKTLNELNILPSLNFIFYVNEKTNIRTSVNKSIAMPSFKEKSIAQIYDPISKRTFIGNIDLNQTQIWNYDLRYELFLNPGEIIVLSGFYKNFNGHIEMTANPLNPNEMKPRNIGTSNVLGGEMEIRKKVKNITFITNFTLVESAVNMEEISVDNSGTSEYDIRLANKRYGENISKQRVMANQSPYSFNFNVMYDYKIMNIALSYNIQGEQLSIVGIGRIPDVYTLPFNSLNLNTNFSFDKQQIFIGISNILNDDRIMVYKSYNAEYEVFNRFFPGRNINLKYVYLF
jgi:hypothetical protein